MASRIKLTCTAGTNSESVVFRLDDPPFLFVADNPSDATWTGSVAIQQSMQPQPDQNFTISGGSGTADSAVTDWTTIIPTLTTGTSSDWNNPLYRIRLNGTNVTGGTAKVYILTGIRTLKTNGPGRKSSRATATSTTN